MGKGGWSDGMVGLAGKVPQICKPCMVFGLWRRPSGEEDAMESAIWGMNAHGRPGDRC